MKYMLDYSHEIANAIIAGTAGMGESISKNTSVSIGLVIVIVGACVYVAVAFNNVTSDVANIKEDVSNNSATLHELNTYLRQQSIIKAE